MKLQNKQYLFLGVLCAFGIMCFSGCDWWPFGKSANKEQMSQGGSGDVLLSINGVPVLTVAKYEEQLAMAQQANPQIGMLLQMMPNAEKDFVFRGMTTAELMKAWAQKEGIDKKEEFKKQRQQLCEAMELQLYMKHFDEAHPVVVNDSDLVKFYDEQKDTIPGLKISDTGVNANYVRFDSKDKAEHFFEKVKDVKKATAFKALAEESKYKVGESVINGKSNFGNAIKDAVLSLNKFPSVKMVHQADDKSYWVLFAANKSEEKYRDFKEIQQGLKKMLIDQRKEKQIEEVVNKLKTEMNVVENNKYFEDKEASKRAAQEEASKASEESSKEAAVDKGLAVKV